MGQSQVMETSSSPSSHAAEEETPATCSAAHPCCQCPLWRSGSLTPGARASSQQDSGACHPTRASHPHHLHRHPPSVAAVPPLAHTHTPTAL